MCENKVKLKVKTLKVLLKLKTFLPVKKPNKFDLKTWLKVY